MSNNNAYWGRHGGSVHRDGSNAFIQQQWGAGSDRDGKSTPRRFHWPLRWKDLGGDSQKLILARDRAMKGA